MKKILLMLTVIATVSFSYAKPPVNEKVLKIFNNVFPTVQDAKWYEYENFYEAYFDKDDIKCRIRFNLDGKIISTTRYYTEKSLSPFLKAKIVQKYPSKSIFGITEVNSDNELVYNIVLEDEKTWMHVRSDSVGQMDVTEKFKKAEE